MKYWRSINTLFNHGILEGHTLGTSSTTELHFQPSFYFKTGSSELPGFRVDTRQVLNMQIHCINKYSE